MFRSALLCTCLILAGPRLGAQDDDSGGSSVKETIKRPFKEAGKAVGDTAVKVGHAVRDGAKAVKEGAKTAGKAVGKGARKAGQGIKEGAHEVGHGVKKAVKKDDTGDE